MKAAILVLLALTSQSFGDVFFDREHGHLKVLSTSLDVAYDDYKGLSYIVARGRFCLTLNGTAEDGRWYHFELTQYGDGTVETDGGGNHELKFRAKDFDSLIEWHPQARERLEKFFEQVGQPEVMASLWMFKVRDGEIAYRCDGETERACQYYFPLLDDSDYRVRTEATLRLASLGEQGALWLWFHNPRSFSAETLMRVTGLLKPYPIDP